jgi:DNA repair protein RadA/Sms
MATATKAKTLHRCGECGTPAPRWSGRCGGCGEWNTLVEERETAPARGALPPRPAARPVRMAEIDAGAWRPRSTGIAELDRVLAGGLVPGSVTLVAGEPGIGKSTLLLQALAAMASAGAPALLVSAEESAQQVRFRAERLGALDVPDLFVMSETLLPAITAAVDDMAPQVVVVDSVQTIFDPDVASAPGSVAQVRGCAHRLVELAKERDTAVVLVGHVTKEGSIAGPRVLEHVVDTVLSFEGDRHHALRLVRAQKHRFGSTGELGVFEMADAGLLGVPDPSGMFLGDRAAGVPGSVVVPTIQGHRPILVELQALTVGNDIPMPRRVAQGFDPARLALLLAVLSEKAGVAVQKRDVYVTAVGGVKISEPGADLAVCLAVVSSMGLPVAADVAVCGEVGLTGEVRQVAQMPRRLAEAARLGFRRAVVPVSAPDGPPGITLERVRTVAAALDAIVR